MKEIVQIRAYKDEDWEPLNHAARADKHSGVYCPTHVSIKDGKIVGYLSTGVIPIVLTWQDRQLVGPMDSAVTFGFTMGALKQYKIVCIPCDPESPYHTTGFLKKAGLKEYTKPVVLYIKDSL